MSHQTLSWVDRLDSLRHNRSREDAVIAHSVATMAAMNLGDVAGARRHLQAGITGSEELQLPVLRAQLRWMEAVLAMWVGDFAEAERHHAIAAHVHEQTELYEAGSGLLASASLLRCRLLECQLAESVRERADLAHTLVSDAAPLGMAAVVEAAEALTKPA